MTADMISNEKFYPIVIELIIKTPKTQDFSCFYNELIL